jgi:Ca2+-binding EF-hand superfamily protein
MGKGDNGGFSQDQIDMYKDCFLLMDIDKDGQINKNDLRAAFDNVGKLMDESELDDMMGEVGGSCTFDAMINMFQNKMAGGSNDPDDLIVRAFRAYEDNEASAGGERKIESQMFMHALKTWGDKFSQSEVDDIFGEFEVDDDGFIASKDVIGLFVSGGGEPKEEAKPEEAAAPPPPEDGADDGEADGGGKKKKKKKKAKA